MAASLSVLSGALRQLQHAPIDISSAANPRLKHLRALLESARERRRSGQTVLDGWHLLDAWLAQGRAVEQIILPRRTLNKLGDAGGNPENAHFSSGRQPQSPAHIPLLQRARWLILDDALFDALDILPSPAPVLALVDAPEVPCPDHIDAHDVVILDRIQDPGNVGAIIRTAAAAGIRTLLTTPGTAACWSPKVLRAGMGGHFVLHIHEGIEVSRLQDILQVPLAGTLLSPQATSLHQADLRKPLAWVFGNEGEGIDPALQALLQLRLIIPQQENVESLNVAAAAAICLFEQRRQRHVPALLNYPCSES